MPGSRPTWYLTHEYVGRDPPRDLQKLQVAPLTVPLFLKGRSSRGSPFMFAGVLATAGAPPLVRAVTADAGCELVNVITVTLTAAAAHSTTAAAAAAAPGLPRILPRPASLAARGTRAGRGDSARWVRGGQHVPPGRRRHRGGAAGRHLPERLRGEASPAAGPARPGGSHRPAVSGRGRRSRREAPPLAGQVRGQAHAAFTSGLDRTLLLAAGVAAVTAGLVAAFLPGRKPAAQAPEPAMPGAGRDRPGPGPA